MEELDQALTLLQGVHVVNFALNTNDPAFDNIEAIATATAVQEWLF